MEVMAVSSLAIIVKGKVMLKKITGIKIRIQMFRVAPFAKYGHTKIECWYKSKNNASFHEEKVDDES